MSAKLQNYRDVTRESNAIVTRFKILNDHECIYSHLEQFMNLY